MQAMKCDRCGSYYEMQSDSKSGSASGMMALYTYVSGAKFNKQTCDLCPKCLKEIKDFVNRENKEQGE